MVIWSPFRNEGCNGGDIETVMAGVGPRLVGAHLERPLVEPRHGPAGPMATLRGQHHGAATVGQQEPQMAIAALADVPQPSTAATGILARRQPKPARKLATAPEGVNVTDGTDQGGRRQLPDTGDRLQLPTDRVGGGQVPELAVDLGDAVLQGPDLLRHAAEHAPQRSRQLRGGIQQRRNLQHRRLRAARRILSSPSASGHDAWSRRRATARHGSTTTAVSSSVAGPLLPRSGRGWLAPNSPARRNAQQDFAAGRPCTGQTRQETRAGGSTPIGAAPARRREAA